MNRSDWHLLLDRYLSGECSPAEQAEIREALEAHGESPAGLDALRAARARAAAATLDLTSAKPATPGEVADALARLDQRLVDARLRPAPTPRLRLRLAGGMERRRRWPALASGLRAAAIASVLIGGAAVAWLVARAPVRKDAAPAVAMREFATPRGQRAVFQLLDGTEVTLGVDSRLRMPASYGTARRDVYLEGEAYFTVVHDEARPFAVHTTHGVARDIGTKFTVRAYHDDPVERVAVAEGIVAVSASGQTAGEERRLVAGQLAVVSPTGVVAVTDHADIDGELAWTHGELRFANTRLSAAVRRLGRWYDLDIRLADPALADRLVSGTYVGEPLDQVLTLITAAVDARFERHGKQVVITTIGGSRP